MFGEIVAFISSALTAHQTLGKTDLATCNLQSILGSTNRHTEHQDQRQGSLLAHRKLVTLTT